MSDGSFLLVTFKEFGDETLTTWHYTQQVPREGERVVVRGWIYEVNSILWTRRDAATVFVTKRGEYKP